MFFRKKVSVEDYCIASLQSVLEPEQKATADAFRQVCDDSHLNAVEAQLYCNHLKALFVELLLIAISKNFGMDTSMNAQIFMGKHLKELNVAELKEIGHDYSQAFAASSTDGVMGMAEHFNRRLTNGRMKKETVERLHGELYAVLNSHFNDFKSIKLFSSMTWQQRAQGT